MHRTSKTNLTNSNWSQLAGCYLRFVILPDDVIWHYTIIQTV